MTAPTFTTSVTFPAGIVEGVLTITVSVPEAPALTVTGALELIRVNPEVRIKTLSAVHEPLDPFTERPRDIVTGPPVMPIPGNTDPFDQPGQGGPEY